MKNQVIELIDKAHWPGVKAYWEARGHDLSNFVGAQTRKHNGESRYYGVINGVFGCYKMENLQSAGAEILTLPEDKPYPKLMRVYDVPSRKYTRVVFMKKLGKYLAWKRAESIEAAKREFQVENWDYAEDIPDQVEVTLAEIAAWKGVEIDKIRIKD